MTDPTPAAGGLTDPRTLEGALRYARTYWQHGNEPETQAALHVLAARTEAAGRELARVTAAVEALAEAHMLRNDDPNIRLMVVGYLDDLRAALSSAGTTLDDLLDRERAKAASEALREAAEAGPSSTPTDQLWRMWLQRRAAAVSLEGGGA